MQMLFIIPLLKTGNPYYIIVNILTDNGENTMQNEKTSVLVLAQCDLTMRETLNTRFGTQCTFTFAENGEHPTAEQLRAAAVIFGEPSEAQLAQTENLRLLQLTWAGADKYTRMENLPQSVVLANASGAFGTIIAEYAIGSLVALYRSFGRYWSNKQAHIWQKLRPCGDDFRQDRTCTRHGRHRCECGPPIESLRRSCARREAHSGFGCTGRLRGSAYT